MSRFLEALRSGRVLLMDGAMGTELQRAGIQEGECYELWNLTHPERVGAIHQAYVDAGAEVLLTNTFQANWVALAAHGLVGTLEKIQRDGAALARAAAGSERWLAFDIGALNRTDFPAAHWTPSIVENLTLGLGDADAVLLETFSDISVLAIVRCMRQSDRWLDDLPILMSLTYHRDAANKLCTADGQEPEYWAEAAEELGAAALGVNCGRDIGMDDIIEIIRRYRQASDLPLFARPNAGTPTRDGDRWVYPHTPAQMAARLPELLEAGVSMVGGCCGTTPEHIAAFRPIVEAWNARR